MWALLVANLRASPGKSAVLGVGAIVLVVLLVRLASGGAKPATADTGAAFIPETTPALAVAPVAVVKEPRLPQPRLRQTIARDPFSQGWLGARSGDAGEGTTGPDTLALQMILTVGDGDRGGLAVISGEVVHPGSIVGGFEVVRIAQRHVVLRRGTDTVQLRMP